MIKAWNKPKLVLLVRGKPEEAVLQVCKINPIGSNPAGPGSNAFDCNAAAPSCGQCSSFSQS